MNEELGGKLKYLRLGGLLAGWDDYLKLAAQKRFSHRHSEVNERYGRRGGRVARSRARDGRRGIGIHRHVPCAAFVEDIRTLGAIGHDDGLGAQAPDALHEFFHIRLVR